MKTIQTNIENVRGIGYINVVCGSTLYAKIPFSAPEHRIVGDMSKEDAEKFSDILVKVIENIENTYQPGDKFKVITMPSLGILTVDVVASNGVVASNERFYSFSNLEKVV